MDAGRVRALFPTFSRDFLPQWRPFGHMACWHNAVFRFLQATLETCSSSQFRASRFIALSLRTIRITRGYKSSADKRYAIVKMAARKCRLCFSNSFSCHMRDSMIVFIIAQENRKVYYFLQDFIFFHKILLLSDPHRFTVFASDLGQIRASEGRNAAADWAERGK